MDVLSALDGFIKAFEELDLERMMSCFSEDATSFFPAHHYQTKIIGNPQIKTQFEKVINKIKAKGLTRISLPVEDLDIVNYGETVLASFHIRDKDLSRRTLVLRKTGEVWLITHLHASNAPLGDKI